MVPIERKARIFSHGALTRYPYQANLHGLPPEVIKECLLGVIEANTRRAVAAAAGDGDGECRRAARAGAPGATREREPEPANFEEYCLRHFGAGISKHFMIPYNEKPLGRVTRATSPRPGAQRFVPLPNLDQVVAGAVGAGPPEMGYNSASSTRRTGGIETFTRALQTRMARAEHRAHADQP